MVDGTVRRDGNKGSWFIYGFGSLCISGSYPSYDLENDGLQRSYSQAADLRILDTSPTYP
jgi:hypothetical protein